MLYTKGINKRLPVYPNNTFKYKTIFYVSRKSKLLILYRVSPLLSNDLETNNETSAARQQILIEQVYAAVTA
jgi:hypothetical protein